MSRASDKIVENVQPHLQPGEQVHGAFAGQSKIGRGSYYTANVATDRRILVFSSGIVSQTKVGKLREELPRQVRLGPPHSTLWHQLQLGRERMYVNRRYWKQLEQIDAAAGFA